MSDITIQEIVEDGGHQTRSYSGRAMYGATCLGVELERGENTAYFLVSLGKAIANRVYDMGLTEYDIDLSDELFESIENVKEDSLGLGGIVYFPDIDYIDDIEHTEEDNESEEEESEG